MTDSVKCCCTFAIFAVSALAEDHGTGSFASGAPIVRPVASETEMVAEKFGDFAKSLEKGVPSTTAEKEKAAFAVLRVNCGSCHGPGKRFSAPAVFRIAKDGRPLDPNGATYLRVMLAAVQNAGSIMPPDEKLGVEDKRTLAAWLATEGVFPRRNIPRPPHIGPNPPRRLFARNRVLSGGRVTRSFPRRRPLRFAAFR